MLQHSSTESRLHETILTALVPTWDSGEETLVFPGSGEFVCGRSLISAARILVPGVAPEHCLMECHEGRATVLPIDDQLVSVNGNSVSRRCLLEAGDVLAIGPAQFRVEVRQPGRFCCPNVFARKPPAVLKSAPAELVVNDAVVAESFGHDQRQPDKWEVVPDLHEWNAATETEQPHDAGHTTQEVDDVLSQLMADITGLSHPILSEAKIPNQPDTVPSIADSVMEIAKWADAKTDLFAVSDAGADMAPDAYAIAPARTVSESEVIAEFGSVVELEGSAQKDIVQPPVAASDAEVIAEVEAVSEEQEVVDVSASVATHANAVAVIEPVGAGNAVEHELLFEDIEDLKNQLELASAQADALRLERDDLRTAVSELKAAFEAVRDELIASQAYVLTNEDAQDGTAAERNADDHELELQDAVRTVQEQQELIDALQQQMSDLAERFEAEAESIRREAQAAVREEIPETDVGLLEEVQQLRQQLSQAESESSAGAVADADIAGYQQLIRELKDQLELAHQQLAQRESATDAGSPESSFAEFGLPRSSAEDFENVFQNPYSDAPQHEQYDKASPASGESVHKYISGIFGSSVRKQVDGNAEPDISLEQSNREDILGAFSVSAEEGDRFDPSAFEEETQAPMLDAFDSATRELKSVSAAPIVPERPSVRSEIAELFGITNSAFQEKPEEERRVSAAAELMSAVDDYSQEDSAAVSMSFSEAEQVLLRPKSSLRPEPEVSPEDDDESHDDFVSQYMEQLLSRNRQSAGGSLPEELTRTQTGATRSAAGKTAVREKPKPQPQVSFIDQYMSGAYSQADGSVDKSGLVSAPIMNRQVAERAPRAKIDVRVLRQNMDSFREISSRSVENALATHAKRRERGNLMKRATILGALSLLCVLVVVASLTGAIPFGLFAWLSIAAVAASGGEFLWKIKGIHEEAEKAAQRFKNGRSRSDLVPQSQSNADQLTDSEQDGASILHLPDRQLPSAVITDTPGSQELAPASARGVLNSNDDLYFEQ